MALPEILGDLQSQLANVKTSIKNGGVSDALQTELVANQDLLQGWVDKIVAGGNVATQDISALENALDDSKKKTLQAQSERTRRTMILVAIGIVVMIGGIIFYFKKIRNK